MKPTQNFPEFITTYQRVLISGWPTMTKLIYKHSALLKEGGFSEESYNQDPTHVISEDQLLDALQGPYSAFFLSKLKEFSALARLRMAAHIDKEDSLKDNLNSIEPALVIPADQLEKFPNEAVTKLLDSYSELVEDQAKQWEGQLFFWQMSLTGALKEGGLEMTEMESEEFASAEPISELLARFDGVNITPPKVDYPISFSNYFKLKSYLLILSALSRQHLPHTEKEIDQHMKHVKKPLQEIAKAEKELLKTQAEAAQTLLAPIDFARFDTKTKGKKKSS